MNKCSEVSIKDPRTRGRTVAILDMNIDISVHKIFLEKVIKIS